MCGLLYYMESSPLMLLLQESSKNLSKTLCSTLMLRIFRTPSPLPLSHSVQQVCKMLMHTSEFWHHIHLVQHVFQHCSKANSSRHIFPWAFIQLHSHPPHGGSSNNQCRVSGLFLCSLAPLAFYLTVGMSCADLEMPYQVWQAAFHLALSRTAVLGAEPCLPIRK